MPAIPSHVALQARAWRNTIGQSGMTPTAFAFLIPIFVVAVAAPFLCVFCIRKRRQAVPVVRPAPKAKKQPALRRAEARERLNEVTQVSSVVPDAEAERVDAVGSHTTADSRSALERECAICLSTLHAPAPPEPAKLGDALMVDEAVKPPSIKDSTAGDPEVILRLQVCQHEFHAECLVSWFVLRKTSCPICRAMYYSQEAMKAHDDEEAAQLAAAAEPQPTPAALEAQNPAPQVRNWRFFLHGIDMGRARESNVNAVEMQPTRPSREISNEPPTQQMPELAPQAPRSRWQRLRGRP